MHVDVTVHAVITAVATVAAFASGPDKAPRWDVNIKAWSGRSYVHHSTSVHDLAFVAQFPGRRLEYQYQVSKTFRSGAHASRHHRAGVFLARPQHGGIIAVCGATFHAPIGNASE
jgi:hypothetical protein